MGHDNSANGNDLQLSFLSHAIFHLFLYPKHMFMSKCSEAFYAELSGRRGADSPTGASISPQPKHHDWLWFTSP